MSAIGVLQGMLGSGRLALQRSRADAQTSLEKLSYNLSYTLQSSVATLFFVGARSVAGSCGIKKCLRTVYALLEINLEDGQDLAKRHACPVLPVPQQETSRNPDPI